MNVRVGDLVVIADMGSAFNGAHGVVVGFVTTYGSQHRGFMWGATNKVQVEMEHGGSIVVPASAARPYGQSARQIGVQMTDLRGGRGVASYDPSVPMMHVVQAPHGPDMTTAHGGVQSPLVFSFDPYQAGSDQRPEDVIWRNLQDQQHTIHPHVYASTYVFSSFNEPTDWAAKMNPDFDPANPPPNLPSRYEQAHGYAPMGPPYPNW